MNESAHSNEIIAPPGRAAAIVVDRPGLRYRLAELGWMALAGVAMVAVLTFIRGFQPIVPAIVVAWLALYGLSRSGEVWAAGPDWVMHRKSWVDLGDLRRVHTRGLVDGFSLRLEDGAGRSLDQSIAGYTRSPAIWGITSAAIARAAERSQVTLDEMTASRLRVTNARAGAAS